MVALENTAPRQRRVQSKFNTLIDCQENLDLPFADPKTDNRRKEERENIRQLERLIKTSSNFRRAKKSLINE